MAVVECIQVVIIKKSMAPFLAIFFFLLAHATTVLGMETDDWKDKADDYDTTLFNVPKNSVKEKKKKDKTSVVKDSQQPSQDNSEGNIQIITTKTDGGDVDSGIKVQSYNDKELQDIQKEWDEDEQASNNEKIKEIWKKLQANTPKTETISTKLPPQPDNTQNISIINQTNQPTSTNINTNNNISGVDDSSGSDDPLPEEEPAPSRSKKYIFIPVVSIVLLAYFAYKYTLWEDIVWPERARDFLSSVTLLWYKMQHRNKLQEIITQDDPVPAPDQKREPKNDQNKMPDTPDPVWKEVEEPIIPIDDGPMKPAQTPPLGKLKYPVGSMRLLGSSISATFLLAFAAYLITTDTKTNRIERTRYDMYRTYFRYAVAALAGTISAVLFFKISQSR